MKKQQCIWDTLPLHQGHIVDPASERRYVRSGGSHVGIVGDRGESRVGLSLQKRFHISEGFFVMTANWHLSAKLDKDPTFQYLYGLAGRRRVVGPDVARNLPVKPSRTLIFFVGEEEYQQELAKRGFGTVLQEKKVWYLSIMIKRKSKANIEYITLCPLVVSLPESVGVWERSASNGRNHSGQEIWLGITITVDLEYTWHF